MRPRPVKGTKHWKLGVTTAMPSTNCSEHFLTADCNYLSGRPLTASDVVALLMTAQVVRCTASRCVYARTDLPLLVYHPVQGATAIDRVCRWVAEHGGATCAS